jgi:DMSO reductase anchor subunit
MRRSWLSREILMFGIFVPLLALTMAMSVRHPTVTALAALVGLAGVFCSMMIYHDTRRTLWNWRRSAALFFGSTFAFGLAAVLAINATNNLFLAALVAVIVAKLLVELNVVRHVTDRELTPLKKTALLVTQRFQHVSFSRLLCAVGGLGAALLLQVGALDPLFAWLPFALVFTGELLERLLFFRAVDAPKMPGGLAL